MLKNLRLCSDDSRRDCLHFRHDKKCPTFSQSNGKNTHLAWFHLRDPALYFISKMGN